MPPIRRAYGRVGAVPAARIAARAAAGEIAGGEHGEPRARVDIGVGAGAQGLGVRRDDLRVGGIVRRQPVGVRLREGPVGKGLGSGGRPIGYSTVQVVTRLVHRTRAAVGPVPSQGPGLPATSELSSWRGPAWPGPSSPGPAWREPCAPVPSWRPGPALLGGSRSGGLAGGGDGGVTGRVRTLDQLGRRGGRQDGVLERLHRRDARLLRRLDPDGLAGCGVPTHPRRPVDLDEFGEARNGDRLALRDDGGDDVSESVDDGDDGLQLDIGLDRDCFC